MLEASELPHAAPVASVHSPALHPLDPLLPREIVAVAEACRSRASEDASSIRFNIITLQEPIKAALLKFERDPQAFPVERRALAVLQHRSSPVVVEVIAVLHASCVAEIRSWKLVEHVQPTVTLEDCLEAEDIVKADVKVQALLRDRYGISDLGLVGVDPWFYGQRYGASSVRGRVLQCFMYSRSNPLDNHYAHPLDMVVCLDMVSRKVTSVWHQASSPPIPQQNSNFHHALVRQERGYRTDLKPLNVLQPLGPSFTVHGNEVYWQKWHFRVSFNYREGLVLHSIRYHDEGSVRPIIHRASLVEIIVPYGDPRDPYSRKCAYDVVDYGLGFSANSLALGCDCLGHIHYFDGVLTTAEGKPCIIKSAVCMHEEDAGMLWKHTEYRNNHSEVRRSRRLVLSFVATIANYEYGFFWYFYQDGSIHFEVKLTGCVSTSCLSPDELASGKPTHGVLVAPGLNAQIHQHFFCARLDMAVDDPDGGACLEVAEVNCESMPAGPDNPYGIGFSARETVFGSELEAQRTVDPVKSRYWKIKNPQSRCPINGCPVAFKLMPHASPPLYALPTSSHATRGAFATKHLWVTPHADDELYPAGFYPLEERPMGIQDWTRQNRSIKGKDCVVWYNFGVTHNPRVEDWPVMPVETCGFALKPVNFFSANPGIDVAPEHNKASVSHSQTRAAAKDGGCCQVMGPSSAGIKTASAQDLLPHSRL